MQMQSQEVIKTQAYGLIVLSCIEINASQSVQPYAFSLKRI